MLELLGSEYVIDHVIAEHNKRMDEAIYRNYVADLVKVIAESQGATVSRRYYDIINKNEVEEKTGDEIALEVIERAGLKVRNHDEFI